VKWASIKRPIIAAGIVGCLIGITLLSLDVTKSTAAPQSHADPLLTLAKEVINLEGGTAVAADFTLMAIGPVTVSGPANTAAVRNQPVPIGTYQLRESGPANYVPSIWECLGSFVSSTSNSVTLAEGDNATCLITNTFRPPTTTTTTTTVPGTTTTTVPGATTTTTPGETTTTVPRSTTTAVPATTVPETTVPGAPTTTLPPEFTVPTVPGQTTTTVAVPPLLPPAPGPGAPAAAGIPPATLPLASTGSDTGQYAGIGVLALLAGLGLVVLARGRKKKVDDHG
jgi:LPXTG-motif cell wall-anchored protein